jgi:membrane protein DedA with SNARE-associated domain
VQQLLDWIGGLPMTALYVTMLVIAAVENVFPPVPADSVVALGSWLAARGDGSVLGAFLATWVGNVAGAAGMYVLGRREGASWLKRRFPELGSAGGEERLRRLYARFGIAALFLSRFVPGVRALVPPFAGALQLPASRAIGAIAVASGLWYGFISYVAFNASGHWSSLRHVIARSGTLAAIVAGALLLIGAGVWYWRRERVHE